MITQLYIDVLYLAIIYNKYNRILDSKFLLRIKRNIFNTKAVNKSIDLTIKYKIEAVHVTDIYVSMHTHSK